MNYLIILLIKMIVMVGIGVSAALMPRIGLWFLIPWVVFFVINDACAVEVNKKRSRNND